MYVQTGYTVDSIYVGLPPDVRLPPSVDERPTIWQKHFWMFIVVLILLLISLITGLLCLICYCCCRTTDKKSQLKSSSVKQPPVTILSVYSQYIINCYVDIHVFTYIMITR